jgi:heat shock protein HslJ
MSRTTTLLGTCLLAACAANTPASGDSPGFDAGPLSRHHWTLADATAADGTRIDTLFARADRPLQLDFADGRVSVSHACNRIGGSYAIEDGRLSVARLASTLMACEDAAVMRLDGEISRRLEAGGTLRYDGDGSLLYATATGDLLRFAAVPTPETKYGGSGEQVFLEVAAQRVPCHHPMMPDYRCLHVREIAYDDRGLKTSEGDWQYLYQDIEGYVHEPGVRNVLRLKRFQVPDPPADGSSVAYVLDMVVESEVVDR